MTVIERMFPIMEAGPEPATTDFKWQKLHSSTRKIQISCSETIFIYDHMISYIRALLQPPQDTLSPEDTRHKEQARSSIEVVTERMKKVSQRTHREEEHVMNENCQGNQLRITDNNLYVNSSTIRR